MDRIVGASADYLKSLLSTRKAQSGDSREDGSSRSDDYEQIAPPSSVTFLWKTITTP